MKKETLNKRLCFRMTEKERAYLEQQAKKNNITIVAFIRKELFK